MIFENEFAFLSYILEVKNITTIYLGILMLWNFKKKYVYVLSWDKKVCHAFLHHKVLFEKKWCIRDSNGRDIIKNILMFVFDFSCKYVYRTILLLMSMILSKASVWFFFLLMYKTLKCFVLWEKFITFYRILKWDTPWRTRFQSILTTCL